MEVPMRRLSVLSALLLAACAPAAQSTTDGAMPTSGAAMAAPQAGILGNYSTTIAAADMPSAAPQDVREQLAGTWGLAFHGGNHFVVTHQGGEVVQGNYQVEGNRIMFAMGETGQYACNTPATYTWGMNASGQLTFALVGTDECDGRIMVLTARPFARTP
jgi:hypothetical protein